MIVTDDEDLAKRCRSLRNLCFEPQKRFVHSEMGFNFRMTNLQAALGKAQLERLDEFIKIKRSTGAKYTELFSDNPMITIPIEKTAYSDNIYWVFGIVLKKECGFNSDDAMKRLSEKKIGTRPFFYPMHLQPVFQKTDLFKNESYPVSENLSANGFYIPSGLALTEDQIVRTAEAVNSIF